MPFFSDRAQASPDLMHRCENDEDDAEAICEAVRRPIKRFAAAKGAKRQAVLVLHLSRELKVRQRTMQINSIRGHCTGSARYLHRA